MNERISDSIRLIIRRPILRTSIILGMITIFVTNHLQITIWKLVDGWSNLLKLGSEALPPDFTVLTERAGWTHPPCTCLLYTSPSPRDRTRSRMPSSA